MCHLGLGAERRSRKAKVAGSIPAGGSFLLPVPSLYFVMVGSVPAAVGLVLHDLSLLAPLLPDVVDEGVVEVEERVVGRG